MMAVRQYALGLLLVAVIAGGPLQAARSEEQPVKSSEAAGEKMMAALDGQELFANTCGFCHADGGRKASKGPKLAGSERSDEFLISRIKKGKQGRMPAFGAAFSDEEILAIVAYIRSLEP